MNRDDLRRLQAHRGFPALSLRLPTHRKLPDSLQDPTRLKNLLRQAEKALIEKDVPGAVVHEYVNRLERFHKNLDYRHLDQGLCVFVAGDRIESVMIPEPVEESVVVGETFLTRDLVRVLNRMPRYHLLVLSEKATRLYEGWGRRLREQTAGPFPMTHDEGDDEPPEGFNRGVDPKMHANERLKVFLNKVASAAQAHANAHRLPLFLAGVDRLRSFHGEVAGSQPLAGEVEGNFDRSGEHELAEALSPVLEEWLQSRRQEVLDRFDAVKGTRSGVTGLQDVGKAAVMGRVDTLLLESGYAEPGSFDRSTGEAILSSGNGALGADDVVDEIVETVMERGGDVVFYRDGRLAGAGAPIGAILRF